MYDLAARLLGAAEQVRTTSGISLPVIEAAAHDELIAQLRNALCDEGFIAQLDIGKRASTDTVIADALRWLQ